MAAATKWWITNFCAIHIYRTKLGKSQQLDSCLGSDYTVLETLVAIELYYNCKDTSYRPTVWSAINTFSNDRFLVT